MHGMHFHEGLTGTVRFEALEVMLLPFAGSASIILFLLALLLDRPVANRTEATLDRVALFTAFSVWLLTLGLSRHVIADMIGLLAVTETINRVSRSPRGASCPR